MSEMTRRGFFGTIPAVAIAPTFALRQQPASAPPGIGFPRHDPAAAREIVGVSHANLTRVKELVSASPALARASWDWGFGDWETALGAASHVGNKEIAAVLLAAGAHPTIFSAAMLGQLEAVKAFVAAAPGIQRTRGPHGISLLSHARAGESVEVVKYLEGLGDADPKYPNEPLTDEDVAGLLGTYAFGTGATDRMTVTRNDRGMLGIKREGEFDRNNLFHHGGRVFNTSGVEAVRLRFEPATGPATTLTIIDGTRRVEAKR